MLRLVLGTVLLAMAAGQAVSFGAMPEILDAYDVLDATAWQPVVVVLIAAELVCGVWFVARPRSQAQTPAWLYTVVAVFWAALGTQAYLRGVAVENCGCFGVYLTQRLSLFVLAQDALLLIYAFLLFRSARRPTAPVRDETIRTGD